MRQSFVVHIITVSHILPFRLLSIRCGQTWDSTEGVCVMSLVVVIALDVVGKSKKGKEATCVGCMTKDLE